MPGLLNSAVMYFYSGAGSPNGFQAGVQGDFCQNLTQNTLYQCITTGNTTGAVWALRGGYTAGTNVTITGNVISSSGSGSVSITAANTTAVVANPSSGVYTIAGGYVGGTGISITGNSIASTIVATAITAANSTAIVTNPSAGVFTVAGGYVAGSGISITGNSIAATGGGAPANATYILQTANGSLTNAQVLGSLSTGLLKNTTSTGLLSIAASPTDYYSPIYQYFYSNPSPLNLYLSVGGAITPSVTGANNVFVGTVPTGLTSGAGNTCIGFGNFNSLVSGSFNSVGGSGAGATLGATATSNSFWGYNAGSGIVGNNNTCLGFQSGYGFDGADGLYLGYGSGPTAAGLVNAGAIGFEADVSVSNGVNIGYGLIGCNNPSPAYSIDLEPTTGGGVAAIAFPVSTLPATSGNKGTLWRDSGDNINYTNSFGTTVALNSAATGIAPAVTQVYDTSSIILGNSTQQNVLTGISSALTKYAILMPDPTMTNPLKVGLPYTIKMAISTSSTTYYPVWLQTSTGSSIFDLNGNTITMNPGDTWKVWYVSSNYYAYLESSEPSFSSAYPSSGTFLGQWFSTTSISIAAQTSYWSYEIVDNLYVNYYLPAYESSLGAATSFAIKTPAGAPFPTSAFPATGTFPYFVISNGSSQGGLITFNPTGSSGQIIINANSSGDDFTGSCFLSNTVITAPL